MVKATSHKVDALIRESEKIFRVIACLEE